MMKQPPEHSAAGLNPDWEPLDPALQQRQLAGLLRLLPTDRAARILDLGCGNGRTLLPLAALGHECYGVDNDPAALDACRVQGADEALADAALRLLHFNFINQPPFAEQAWPSELVEGGYFDLITCLGHTFMLVIEPARAVTLLQDLIALLEPTGAGSLVIDNFPADLWPCVTTGAWQGGVSDDGEMQIVWAEDDNVFALRTGAENVDLDQPAAFKPTDRLHRLWTRGELALLARAAGIDAPTVDAAGHLICFRR